MLKSALQKAFLYFTAHALSINAGLFEEVFDAATTAAAALESDTTKTGYEKLEAVVTQLLPMLPDVDQKWVKVVLGLIVDAALYFHRTK